MRIARKNGRLCIVSGRICKTCPGFNANTPCCLDSLCNRLWLRVSGCDVTCGCIQAYCGVWPMDASGTTDSVWQSPADNHPFGCLITPTPPFAPFNGVDDYFNLYCCNAPSALCPSSDHPGYGFYFSVIGNGCFIFPTGTWIPLNCTGAVASFDLDAELVGPFCAPCGDIPAFATTPVHFEIGCGVSVDCCPRPVTPFLTAVFTKLSCLGGPGDFDGASVPLTYAGSGVWSGPFTGPSAGEQYRVTVTCTGTSFTLTITAFSHPTCGVAATALVTDSCEPLHLSLASVNLGSAPVFCPPCTYSVSIA